MSIDNSVTLIGNVTRDPELKFTNGGASVIEFGLAYNRKWTDRNTQEEREEVSFFDVTAWAGLADNIGNSINKGDRVVVLGRLKQDSWEDKETGKTRSKVVIIADEVSPSLRWATIPTLVKNERSGGGRPAPGRPAPGRQGQAQQAAPVEDFSDEPF